jgi:putative ABC transport system permease protein
MLLYNVRLAWKSVQRHPVLSILIVLGIALGVGVSTTFITAYHVLAGDPVPGKSDVLYYVRMDSWGLPDTPFRDGPPPLLPYRDVRELLKSDIPVRRMASFTSRMTVFPTHPQKAQERPFREDVLLTTSDFFAMFNVPFQYGGAWDRAADAKPEAVAVISADLNDRLFGGRDSVGRTFRLDDRDFRVAGVLAPWRPRVRGYDLINEPLEEPQAVFMPLEWVGPMEVSSSGNQSSWRTSEPGEEDLPFIDRLVLDEVLFFQLWVELPDAARVKAFQGYLDAYVAEQKKLGRFPHKPDNRLTPLLALMEELEVVPPQTKALAAISLLFLVVAALNLIGLFLGKFLARASTVGVRRALGASRGTIFFQHLVECELMGLVGGSLGVLLSLGGLAVLNRVYGDGPDGVPFFQLDVPMIVAAVVLSLVAGAIAGIYPAWRICAIPPARHLKNQ